VIEDADEKRHALYGLISKYFPDMRPGQEYRPIAEAELKRTSVYASPSRVGAANAIGLNRPNKATNGRA